MLAETRLAESFGSLLFAHNGRYLFIYLNTIVTTEKKIDRIYKNNITFPEIHICSTDYFELQKKACVERERETTHLHEIINKSKHQVLLGDEAIVLAISALAF